MYNIVAHEIERLTDNIFIEAGLMDTAQDVTTYADAYERTVTDIQYMRLEQCINLVIL
jgi:hypothetical protein